MKKIVFGTVIYSKAEAFFDSFLKCLEDQTTNEFDILLINDNLNKMCINILERKLCESGFTHRYSIVQGEKRTGCLSDFRVQMMEEACAQGYELLVIGDIDDLFKQNRVEEVYRAYKNNSYATFYYNDLVDENGRVVLLDLPKKVDNIQVISQKNFLGMSNTAINLNKVSHEFIESMYMEGCNIFDWYLYSRILIFGGIGIKVENTSTIYRIYGDNLAGIQGDSIKEIEREREIKISHYQRLIPFSKRFLKYTEQLESIIIDDKFYNTKNYNKNKCGYWWNNIQLEEKNV